MKISTNFSDSVKSSIAMNKVLLLDRFSALILFHFGFCFLDLVGPAAGYHLQPQVEDRRMFLQIGRTAAI